MSNVLIRNMPEQIYQELQQRAKRNHRSIPAENVHLLEQLFQQEDVHKRHQGVMQRIIADSKDQQRFPDSLPLLRESRDER